MSRGHGKIQRRILEVLKSRRKIERVSDLARMVYYQKGKSNTGYTRSQYITVYNALQRLIEDGVIGIEFE